MIKLVKPSIFMIILITVLISGCGNAANPNEQTFDFTRGYGQDDYTRNINKEDIVQSDPYTRYGFQRNTKETALGTGDIPGYAVYDRPLLAESISEMAAVIPNVFDVGVLVTDKHVLMVYDSTGDDREAIANQVRQTARSVVPAYFDIYVSDDVRLMSDIERFQGQSPHGQADTRTLEKTIERMKNSPQGDND